MVSVSRVHRGPSIPSTAQMSYLPDGFWPSRRGAGSSSLSTSSCPAHHRAAAYALYVHICRCTFETPPFLLEPDSLPASTLVSGQQHQQQQAQQDKGPESLPSPMYRIASYHQKCRTFYCRTCLTGHHQLKPTWSLLGALPPAKGLCWLCTASEVIVHCRFDDKFFWRYC